MKKIFLLLWFVLLGLFEVQAYQFEKNGIYYDIVNGKAVVVSGDVSYSGDVVIPETVEYYGHYYVVDSIGGSAFYNCGELTSVRLPEGLKTIGMHAFLNCSGLTSLSFPEGLKAIGGYAFSGCSGLTSLSFPKGLKIIGESAFSNCSGLTSLSFPEGMTKIGDGAFIGCGRLETLSFPSTMKSIECLLWKV